MKTQAATKEQMLEAEKWLCKEQEDLINGDSTWIEDMENDIIASDPPWSWPRHLQERMGYRS